MNYERRKTIEVDIGGVKLGGNNPIRIQSMTTTNTMDTKSTVEQIIRLIKVGCDYVRVATPSLKEVENLKNIKQKLSEKGYYVPLIADIHFTPHAAELASTIVEKVRINPGNYADRKRSNIIEYTNSTYQQEISRIRKSFAPLVNSCKEYGTAMRIGTNHGSLSDRIMSRYGDTSLGMVESALEFLRICQDMNYHNIVLSMKASNVKVMVQAYRLLVEKLNEEKMKAYPLHLGVTEAGNGMDGRIKSAIGIGTLLESGLGDTIRVSLTEEPECEVPIAAALLERYSYGIKKENSPSSFSLRKKTYEYQQVKTIEIENLGGNNVPRVIADISNKGKIIPNDLKQIGHFYLSEQDKWFMNDQGSDYIYTGQNKVDFTLPNGLKEIVDIQVWEKITFNQDVFPLLTWRELGYKKLLHKKLNFIYVIDKEIANVNKNKLLGRNNIVLIIHVSDLYATYNAISSFLNANILLPIVLQTDFPHTDKDKLQLYTAINAGSLLIDGIGNGVMLKNTSQTNKITNQLNSIAFCILQATRMRMTKTEYISCPSCGRTRFDLQETTAMIRKRTEHLKGIRIGIMGCIVNGPGEMADAHYGYVGSGKEKITLYRGKQVVKKAIPASFAVDEMIELIRQDGNWIEPENNN